MYCALKYCRPIAAGVVLLCLGGMPTLAVAQNFQPIAKATPLREEVFLGQPILFSSAESLDPDEGLPLIAVLLRPIRFVALRVFLRVLRLLVVVVLCA